ncbi:sugar ABC transporter permease, partial [Streptomyces sp. NPDC093594]
MAIQWMGRACVWASSGTAEDCTRSVSCEGCAGGGGQPLRKPFRGRGLLRAAMLLPYCAPVVAVAFVWE